MSEQPPLDPVDIREQLAALLAAELDADVADRLQDRIDAEPWVAALADEVADAMVAVGAVDAVEPPAGYAQRLREGLAAEVGHPIDQVAPDARRLHAAGAAAATGWAGPSATRRTGVPGRTDTRRPSRDPGRSRTGRFLAVAAAVAVLAVAGVGVLTSSGFLGGGDDTAADAGFESTTLGSTDAARLTEDAAGGAAAEEEAGSTQALEADAPQQEAFDAEPSPAQDDADDGAAEGSAADTVSAATAPAGGDEGAEATEAGGDVASSAADGPAVLDVGELSGDDQTVTDVLGRHPAAEALLGTDASSVAELGAAYRDELLRAPPFADGTPAGACLSEVLDQAGDAGVPAVAARADLPEGPSVAYTLVRARGQVLDTVDVWILDLGTCALRRVVSTGDR